MYNKLLYTAISIVLFIGIFIIFPAVVNAKGLNFFCSKRPDMVVTLKNDANVDIAKGKISKISHIKIIKTTYRDKEWSKMVNKMDLPNIENPFKNELIIKINKNANTNEIHNKIKTMDYVENIKYVSDTKCTGE